MSINERDIAKYAALVAAGVYTEDALLDLLGDDSVVNQIMAVAGASAVMGAASGVVEDVVDTTFDVAEDVIDTINPFNW